MPMNLDAIETRNRARTATTIALAATAVRCAPEDDDEGTAELLREAAVHARDASDAAREDVPALVAEVRRLREERLIARTALAAIGTGGQTSREYSALARNALAAMYDHKGAGAEDVRELAQAFAEFERQWPGRAG